MKVDFWTLLWQAINLLVLLVILRWLLFKPLQKVIDQRQKRVQEQTDRAQAALDAAQTQQAELNAAKAELEASRLAILQQARDQARKLLQTAQAQAQQDAEAAQVATRERLQEERLQAEQGLIDQAAAVATELATHLLQQVSNSQPDQPFIEALLAALDASTAEERLGWQAPDAPKTVTLASAHPLSEAQHVQLTQRLQTVLGSDCAVGFCADASLLAGAELRFSHGVLARHWAAQLAAAKQRLSTLGSDDATADPAGTPEA